MRTPPGLTLLDLCTRLAATFNPGASPGQPRATVGRNLAVPRRVRRERLRKGRCPEHDTKLARTAPTVQSCTLTDCGFARRVPAAYESGPLRPSRVKPLIADAERAPEPRPAPKRPSPKRRHVEALALPE